MEGYSLVFMEDSWCWYTANLWVPAKLPGVWKRACVSADAVKGEV